MLTDLVGFDTFSKGKGTKYQGFVFGLQFDCKKFHLFALLVPRNVLTFGRSVNKVKNEIFFNPISKRKSNQNRLQWRFGNGQKILPWPVFLP
jgi:hypothetical protein